MGSKPRRRGTGQPAVDKVQIKNLIDRIATLKMALKRANTELRTLRAAYHTYQAREAAMRAMVDQRAGLDNIRRFLG